MCSQILLAGIGSERLNYVSAHSNAVPNITLAVPEDLHRKMRRHREVKWSEVVRRVIAERIRDLEAMDRITAKSVLSPADVDALDHLLKVALLQRYQRRSEG